MKSEKGLTMVELLVTITIIVFVATSLIVISDRALAQVSLYSTRVQASFLAEEAMEILTDQTIRNNIRNDIALHESNEEWEGEGFWEVDYNGDTEEKESREECGELWVDVVNGFFYHNSDGEDSPFSRCIIIETNDSEGDLRVEVETILEHKGEEITVNLYRIFYD